MRAAQQLNSQDLFIWREYAPANFTYQKYFIPLKTSVTSLRFIGQYLEVKSIVFEGRSEYLYLLHTVV